MMEMWTWLWVTLSKSGQGHSCFFKLKLIFFITYFCSLSWEFPTQYNKVTFHWVLSKLWSLKVTILPTLFMYACTCEQDSYTCVIHSYPHCLTYTHVRKWVQFFPIEQLNFPLFLVYLFLSFFFTLVDFFKAFFENDRLQFKWNHWYILVLGEAGWNYCRTESL